MAFLKKDMNRELLSVIIITIVAFAIFTVVYQTNLDNIYSEYENKSKEFEKITARLISEEAKLQKISQLQENAQKDKGAIEASFNNFRDENEKLQKDLASIRVELQTAKGELQGKTNEFNLLQNRFYNVEQSLIGANSQISRLSVRVKELCNKLLDAGGSDEDC